MGLHCQLEVVVMGEVRALSNMVASVMANSWRRDRISGKQVLITLYIGLYSIKALLVITKCHSTHCCVSVLLFRRSSSKVNYAE